MIVMIFVPRQLRRSDFPSSVPYYGGRLTPQVISGLEHDTPPRPRPAVPTPASDVELARRLAALDDLQAEGFVTEAEYDELRRRIMDGG
jgi:hypothetical protein